MTIKQVYFRQIDFVMSFILIDDLLQKNN